MPETMRGLFITGTDTAVGKTQVAVSILTAACRDGINVGAYKPVCSGADWSDEGTPSWNDVEQLHAALEGRFPRQRIAPQCFSAPLAPPIAAQLEGRMVDESLLREGWANWAGDVDLLVVEGAGGLLCPVSERLTVADLAMELGHPLVIVVANRLGCLNHALLTLECARNRGLAVAAVVLNHLTPPSASQGTPAVDVSTSTNADFLESFLRQFSPSPPLIRLGWGESQAVSRRTRFSGLDWYDLACSPS